MNRLTGGIAHDFNILLTAISGLSDLVLKDLGPDHASTTDVQEIRKAVHSAAALTRQLLAISRPQMLHPQVIDVNEVVERIDSLLRRLIGENIALVTDLVRQRARPREHDECLSAGRIDPVR